MKYILKMILLAALLSFLFPCQCIATETNAVTAKPNKVGANCEVRIPIVIENNQGIIGFRITVKYDESQIRFTDVYRGNVTEKGLFNNNINMAPESFDVLWSYTEDVSENGTIFELVGKTSEDLRDDVVVEISYSQEDTFNEKMEDVLLQCKDVTLVYDEKEKDKVLEDEHQPSSDAQEYVDNAMCDMDAQEIIDTIDAVLDKHDVEDIEQVSDDKIIKVSEEAVDAMEEKGVSSEYLTNEQDKVVAIKELYRSAMGNSEMDKENSIDVGKQVEKIDTNMPNKIDSKIIIILVLSSLIIVGIIFVLVRKKGK